MKRGIKQYLILILMMGSCAPKVASIYNSSEIQSKPTSFYIYPLDENKSVSADEKRLDQELIAIIKSDLEAKGLKESSIPDIYISFIINIHTSEETTVNNYNRYDRYRYYNYGYMDPNYYSTNQYKEGVLIIDIRNSDNKLVWQGSKSFKVKNRESVKEMLPQTCAEIIASFDLERF